MDCKKTEKYIFLKPDELTLQQVEELKLHLSFCEKCRETISANHEFRLSIAKLKEQEPVLFDPQLFTAQILAKINEKGIKSYSIQHAINSFVDWFLLPALKPTLVAVSIFLILLLSYQQATDQFEINSLEMKMKKYSFKNGLTPYNTLKFKDFEITDSSFSKKSKWFRTLFSSNQNVRYATFSFPHINKYFLIKSDSSSTKKLFSNLLLTKHKAKIRKSDDSITNSIKK
jgi:hypothetical protein